MPEKPRDNAQPRANPQPPEVVQTSDGGASGHAGATSHGRDLSKATSIRPVARLLSEPLAVWVVAGNGRISYASAACGRWLNVSPDQLVGRAGTAKADGSFADPVDALVFSLRPPLVTGRGPLPIGASSLAEISLAFVTSVRPSAVHSPQQPEARKTLFVPIPDDDAVAYLGIAGIGLRGEKGLADADFSLLIDAVRRQLAVEPRLLAAPVLIGESVWAIRLQKQIEAASLTTSHVTLHCPRGGGGEMLARQIHAKRPDARDDLIRVAGALMDAELFDAMTGGLVNQLLEDASTCAAVLILDLDQMPLDAQQRLALLLHNHGSRLRVFATTMVPSKELAGVLLSELAAQLGLIEISVPPLRERIEDLPAMAAALLHRRHAAGETSARQLGREALDRLVLYPWPENYEELDAAIRGAARQCNGETIRVEHLPLAMRSYGHVDSTTGESDQLAAKIIPLDQALADAERSYIKTALERAGGNRAAAARLLEISRGRLLRRIEQLGIEQSGNLDD